MSMPEDAAAPHATADAAVPTLPTDADLRALLAAATGDEAARLRALVQGYLTLRHVLRDVLAFLAAREGGAAIATVPVLARARALVASATGAP